MFSFKINKKASSTAVPRGQKELAQASSKKAFHDDDDKEEEEPDFIDGLDGTKILSKKEKKPEKKALVIPLITKNEWRVDKKRTDNNEDNSERQETGDSKNGKEEPTISLQDQAAKELMEEALSKTSSDKKDSKSIPILFQNRVPDGYEEDDNMDVSLRPDQSTLDDYDRIPIEEFGLAMLRGMGWKETEGIGLKNKQVVNMAEPKLRPKGMGLGAEAAHLNKDVAPKNTTANSEDKEDLTFKIGGYAVITKGSKKGHYGQIESFDEDNNRVIMKLGINGKMEAVSKFYINVVSSKEYKKNSKVINSEKYEEYKAKQESKERHRNEDDKTDSRSADEQKRRRGRRSESDSDDDDDYKSRSKSRKNGRDDYNNEHRSEKRSKHRDRDDDRSHHKTSERDKRDDSDRDRHYSKSRRHGDKDRSHDDYYRNSNRNGDRRSDRDYYSSRKGDERDRKRRD